MFPREATSTKRACFSHHHNFLECQSVVSLKKSSWCYLKSFFFKPIRSESSSKRTENDLAAQTEDGYQKNIGGLIGGGN